MLNGEPLARVRQNGPKSSLWPFIPSAGHSPRATLLVPLADATANKKQTAEKKCSGRDNCCCSKHTASRAMSWLKRRVPRNGAHVILFESSNFVVKNGRKDSEVWGCNICERGKGRRAKNETFVLNCVVIVSLRGVLRSHKLCGRQ